MAQVSVCLGSGGPEVNPPKNGGRGVLRGFIASCNDYQEKLYIYVNACAHTHIYAITVEKVIHVLLSVGFLFYCDS
jgi:hypothetical protein